MEKNKVISNISIPYNLTQNKSYEILGTYFDQYYILNDHKIKEYYPKKHFRDINSVEI
jgi:hypothetical protein